MSNSFCRTQQGRHNSLPSRKNIQGFFLFLVYQKFCTFDIVLQTKKMYSCQNLIDLAPGRLGDMEIHSNGDAGAQAARAIPPSKMRGPSKMLSVCNLQSFGTWQQRWDKAHASIPVILGRAGPDLGCSPSVYSLLPLAIRKLGVLDPRHAPWTCRCPSFWRALWAACVRGK